MKILAHHQIKLKMICIIHEYHIFYNITLSYRLYYQNYESKKFEFNRIISREILKYHSLLHKLRKYHYNCMGNNFCNSITNSPLNLIILTFLDSLYINLERIFRKRLNCVEKSAKNSKIASGISAIS
jgi:hypothetical protein